MSEDAYRLAVVILLVIVAGTLLGVATALGPDAHEALRQAAHR